MSLEGKNVLLTGASGGIGREVALQLAAYQCNLGLLGRRLEPLEKLCNEISVLSGVKAVPIVADIASDEQRKEAVRKFEAKIGPIDVLINNAGVVDFRDFSYQSPEVIDSIFTTNLLAPVQLTRQILPGMLARNSGHIVNIGSTFGSIGFSFFASYAASKFALRGFSESLRREVDGTGVTVSYLAPRAVRTSANSEDVYRMADATGMNMDEPLVVASFIVRAIQRKKELAFYGWPEKLFVRINAILPKLVDMALRKQTKVMAPFAHKPKEERDYVL